MGDIGFELLFINIVIILSSLLIFRLKGSLMSIGLLFNAYAMLYFSLGLSYFYLNYDISKHVVELTTIATCAAGAIASFNIVYILLMKKGGFKEFNEVLMDRKYLAFIFLLAVLFKFYVIVSVGFMDFFFIDRLDRFPIMKQYNYELYISDISKLTFIAFLHRYFVTKKSEDFRWVMINGAYLTFFAVFLVSRAELAFLAISILYLAEINKVMKTSTIVYIGLVLVGIMFFYKGVISSILLERQTGTTFNPSEFINWIRNSMVLLKENVTSSDLPGNSYLLALKGSLFINIPTDAPSEWFIKEFYPSRVVTGLTYGFSGALEGFLYIGYLGVALHFALVALFFALIERVRGALGALLVVSILFIMFRLFRSELYNFSRTFIWYYLYPSVCIFIFERLLRKAVR